MDHKENLRKTYNKIAKDWNFDHLEDDWWLEETEKFINLVGKGKTVLDIGCGTGLKAKFLMAKGLNVVGIDLSENMIKIAKDNFPKCEFHVMDMEEIQFNRKFDGIYAQACLLHVKKNKAAEIVEHWVSFIEPKGYLYIAVKESSKGIDEEVIKENDYGYEYERFFSFYTKKEIEKYMKDAGLEIVYSTVEWSEHTNWIQVIGRKR